MNVMCRSMPVAQQPYRLVESTSNYFIFVKLPAISKGEVIVDMSERRHQIVVLAKRRGKLRDQMTYWEFAVPSSASMQRASVKLRRGTLAIQLPKERFVGAA